MTTWQPVFVDGPLQGQSMPVTSRETLLWPASFDPERCPYDPARYPPPLKMGPPPLVYRFSDVAMFGYVVLVGSIAQPPKPGDLFRVLTSEAARSAVHAVRYEDLARGSAT